MGNSKIRMTHFIAMVWNEPTISLRYDCKCVIFLYRLFQIIHTGIATKIMPITRKILNKQGNENHKYKKE